MVMKVRESTRHGLELSVSHLVAIAVEDSVGCVSLSTTLIRSTTLYRHRQGSHRLNMPFDEITLP